MLKPIGNRVVIRKKRTRTNN